MQHRRGAALLLRTDEGVPLQHLRDTAPEKLQKLISEGMAEIAADKLRLLGRGPLLVDSVVEYLISGSS